MTFENGQNLGHTHCFPARTAPTRRAGVGHWLVAYRKAEEARYRNVHRKYKETKKKQGNKGSSVGSFRTLDKDLLLKLHCVDEPFELSAVNIFEQNFTEVKDEDLNLFNNVIQIDASLNFLSLDHFKTFVSLRELNLSLNRLQDMTFDPDDFPNLEVLDLSYNSLTTDTITAIGLLSRLRVLHLTENQLHHLPPNLSTSNEAAFKSLEVLMLDDNKLSSDVFDCLTNLKRLKYLNLKGNVISEVPLLELLNHLKTQEASADQTEADVDSDGNICENLLQLMQYFQQKDWEDDKHISFPFPELHFVNLSHNKIAEEEALFALALFPMLSEIDISSNPLTTRRSGDPPLLTYYLQDKLGVKIKRKNEQEAKTLTKAEPKWKPSEVISNVSTKMLDHQTHVETEREATLQLYQDQIIQHQTPQPFFVTETELDTETHCKESLENLVDFTSHISQSDAKTDPTLVEPMGIQTAVRMLEHTLKNLNVYRDSKPKLDSIQTPYREKEKRIKALPPPPALPLKQQSEQLDRMIEEIKLNKTMREVPLSKVIKREDGNKQDYREAVSLLKDMKAKYKMVHRKTMEQEASLGSKKPTI
ncbi:hypothetical protein WMY93_007806 [Mugilogobius chulae]|uniref:X-ray radiation resistance-associated protein 1 n=1 Tax=Mugilogobius chulae TaxID=88201 RepID=A0AAW0PE32_9GOBI